MSEIPDSAREALARAPLAHVVTTNRDGTPQVSCTWISVDGDRLVIASLGENQKVKNLRRDPRVVLSFESTTKNAMGITEYLIVYGRATVVEGGAPSEWGRSLGGIPLTPRGQLIPTRNRAPVTHLASERSSPLVPCAAFLQV
jgi:PPOX class probable F420-dependent enzyme